MTQGQRSCLQLPKRIPYYWQAAILTRYETRHAVPDGVAGLVASAASAPAGVAVAAQAGGWRHQ